jgi:holliday junction DNA helicase RuvA
MFSRISGSLIERGHDTAVIEAGGLGYEIILPPCIAEKIPSLPGERVTLEIYAVMNQDGNTGRFAYYGFSNAIERDFFERRSARDPQREPFPSRCPPSPERSSAPIRPF